MQAEIDELRKDIEHLKLAVQRLSNGEVQPETKQENANCWWQDDEDGVWYTGCCNAHVFIDGGPWSNKYKFCPYCGKPLTKVQP